MELDQTIWKDQTFMDLNQNIWKDQIYMEHDQTIWKIKPIKHDRTIYSMKRSNMYATWLNHTKRSNPQHDQTIWRDQTIWNWIETYETINHTVNDHTHLACSVSSYCSPHSTFTCHCQLLAQFKFNYAASIQSSSWWGRSNAAFGQLYVWQYSA